MSDVLIYGADGRPIAMPQRSIYSSLLDGYNAVTFNGVSYPLGMSTTIQGNREELDGSFNSFAQAAYASDGVVFACMLVRMSLFSQVRFMWQQLKSGQPGDLFSSPALDALNDRPSPGQTGGDLLARAILDADLAGNSFIVSRAAGRLKRLRPDWVSILLGSQDDPVDGPYTDPNSVDAEVLGYVYWPGGKNVGKPEFFLAEEVCHFAPIPDPLAHFRGMSWLTPVIREIQGDIAASEFKVLYFTNGASPNLVVNFDASVKKEAFGEWVKAIEQNHAGVANAYRTLYLGAGATATRIGSNLSEADFSKVQGASETRIAAAAGLHPAIVGLSEGLSGSSLNEGNFAAAARLTSDKTFRFLWGNFAGSMQTILPPPQSNARLWYDASQVSFLQDDEKDRAQVLQTNATTINALVAAGWTWESAKDAVLSGDYRRLEHTGLFSVQLQAPGSTSLPTVPPDNAPDVKVLPPEPPKQIPAKTGQSSNAVTGEVRCINPECGKLLAELASAPYRMTCGRCKTLTAA